MSDNFRVPDVRSQLKIKHRPTKMEMSTTQVKENIYDFWRLCVAYSNLVRATVVPL